VIHDRDLLDRLCELPQERFEARVYRATGLTKNATATSIAGGRWAPPSDASFHVPVLYTSLEREGALAEVSSFLGSLTPIPKSRKLLKLTRLNLTVAQTTRITPDDLSNLGVDMTRYGERDYDRTQQIGAALAFLGADGLIAPSARWPCDNLVVFAENHGINEKLDVEEEEEVDWLAWAVAQGII
jgi:RES domain-containing protein